MRYLLRAVVSLCFLLCAAIAGAKMLGAVIPSEAYVLYPIGRLPYDVIITDAATGVEVVANEKGTDIYMNYTPFWSPNGRWLTFTTEPYQGAEHETTIIDMHTGYRQTFQANSLPMSWSSDSKNLVLYDSDNFYLFDLQTETSYDLFIHKSDMFISYVWSPDSRFISYSAHPLASSELSHASIYLYEVSNQTHINLTEIGFHADGLRWSPDGRYIFLYGTDPSLEQNVWLYDVNSEQARKIPVTSPVSHPVWLPDSSAIAFSIRGEYFSPEYYPYRYVLDTGITELHPHLTHDGFGAPYWSWDGQHVVRALLADTSISVVTDTVSGDEKIFRDIDTWRWLPDGRRALYSKHLQTYMLDVGTWETQPFSRHNDTNLNSITWQPRP